jgi:hypothetical protein
MTLTEQYKLNRENNNLIDGNIGDLDVDAVLGRGQGQRNLQVFGNRFKLAALLGSELEKTNK